MSGCENGLDCYATLTRVPDANRIWDVLGVIYS